VGGDGVALGLTGRLRAPETQEMKAEETQLASIRFPRSGPC
jgi:hypothetical protein